MMDFTVLKNQETKTSKSLAKISYLQSDKQTLSIKCTELSLNNQVLRNVISNLSKQTNDYSFSDIKQSLDKLVQRNETVQNQFVQLLKTIQDKNAQIFLIKQVNNYSQIQTQQTITNYEQKILQLRKLIQSKEYQIQQYEKLHPQLPDTQEILIPPYNCSLHFYAEIDDYKALIDIYEKKNKTMRIQNQNLQRTVRQLEKKIQLLSRMFQNRWSYSDYNDIMKSRDRCYSVPKQYNKTVQNSQKTNQFSKMQTTINMNNIERGVLPKKLLMKLQIQIKKLKNSIIKLQNDKKQLKKINSTLVDSNNFYQQKRKQSCQQLKKQRLMVKNLTDFLLGRTKQLSQQKQYRVQDDIKDILIKKNKIIKLFKNYSQPTKRQYQQIWSILKAQVNKLNINFISKQRITKSYSNIGDYHMNQNYYNYQHISNNQQNLNTTNNLLHEDFSIIIGGSKKYSLGKINKNYEEDILDLNFDDL